MDTVRSTVRLLITASLLLSLGTVSLYPRLMAGEAPVSLLRGERTEKVCCCGTQDGRCCGGACCQMPNPKEDKAPASPNRLDDRGQPLDLAWSEDANTGGPRTALFHGGFAADPVMPVGSSLIALSIRLNI